MILEVFEGMSQLDVTIPYTESLGWSTTGDGILGRGSEVGSKMLMGGSSGLNLQLAGEFGSNAGSGTVLYDVFNVSGYYWTSTPANSVNGSIPDLQPGHVQSLFLFRVFNDQSSYNLGDPTGITRGYFSSSARSVRCVKD